MRLDRGNPSKSIMNRARLAITVIAAATLAICEPRGVARAEVLDALDTSVTAWDKSYAQTFTWSGSKGAWTWAPTYGFSWSKSEDGDSSWAHRFKTTGGHRFPHFFEAALDLSYLVKPATEFSAFGPGLELSRKFEVGSTKKRAIRVALRLAMMAYHQKTYDELLALYPKMPKAVNLLQNSLGLKGRASLTPWLSTTLGYQHFFYNRSVRRLLDVMESPRAVRSGAARLGDQVGSFYSDLVEISAGLFLLDRWLLDFGFSVQRLASGDGWGRTWSVMPGFDLGFDWTLSLGFERTTEPAYQQNSVLLACPITRLRTPTVFFRGTASLAWTYLS